MRSANGPVDELCDLTWASLTLQKAIHLISDLRQIEKEIHGFHCKNSSSSGQLSLRICRMIGFDVSK
jgi:hypothetical protein